MQEGGSKNKQPQQHLGYEVITGLCTRNNRLAPPRPQMFPPIHRPKPTNQTPNWRPKWGPRCRPSPHPSTPPPPRSPSPSGSWRRSPAFSHPATKETEWAWTASCAVGLSDHRVCEPPDLHICGASGRDSGRRFANYSLIPSPFICTVAAFCLGCCCCLSSTRHQIDGDDWKGAGRKKMKREEATLPQLSWRRGGGGGGAGGGRGRSSVAHPMKKTLAKVSASGRKTDIPARCEGGGAEKNIVFFSLNR